MEVQQLKATLHQQIEQAEASFLRILLAMTEAYLKEQKNEVAISANPKPSASSERKVMTMEELKDEIRTSQAEFERGEFYTVEALEQDMESW